jgi:hypothetical protein
VAVDECGRMIIVTTAGPDKYEFPNGARFLTEEIFNNLCIHDEDDSLLAVFAQGEWISVEVGEDG